MVSSTKRREATEREPTEMSSPPRCPILVVCADPGFRHARPTASGRRAHGGITWLLILAVLSGWGLSCSTVLAAAAPQTLRQAGSAPPQEAPAEDPAIAAALKVQQAIVVAIERAEPAVVAIARVKKSVAGTGPLVDPRSPEFMPNEFATGVVISADGLILTNHHVLGDPEQNEYFVWISKRPFKVQEVLRPTQVLAANPWMDLALLKVNATDLKPIKFGSTQDLKRGMIVLTLGNPYAIARDGQASASWGILANVARSAVPEPNPIRTGTERDTIHHFGTLLQTDARLNLGSSGGALLNLRGEMIGLTTALAALAGTDQPGGFAIPTDAAFMRTLDALKQGKQPTFGFLGILPDDRPIAERQRGLFGAVVLRVVPGSPAELAGVQKDDIVTHVDQQRIESRDELFRELGRRSAQQSTVLTLLRVDPQRQRRRTLQLTVTLSKKYLETARRPYSSQPREVWRGLDVDYATALPPQISGPYGAIDPKGCVGILTVDVDSPAWNAGLRPGDFVSHIGLKRVATPQEFFQVARQASGTDDQQTVELHLTIGKGKDAIRRVPPESESTDESAQANRTDPSRKP